MFRVAFRPKVSIVFVLVALLASVTLLLLPSQASATASVVNRVSVWLTTANLQGHITQQKDVSFSTGSSSGVIKITVDENKMYQQMDGFGASITDGSAWLIYNKMSKSQRAALMGALFDPVKGIGLNFLRQPGSPGPDNTSVWRVFV